MVRILKPGTGIAAALALASIVTTTPAHAACIVEGIAYPTMDDGTSDPTGPSVYIKKSPRDSFYYFVRLRDGGFIDKIRPELGQVRILVQGSAINCPKEGILRDLGTAIREPQVIAYTAKAQNKE